MGKGEVMAKLVFDWDMRDTMSVSKTGEELGELSCAFTGRWVYYLPESELFLTAKQQREIADTLDEQNSREA